MQSALLRCDRSHGSEIEIYLYRSVAWFQFPTPKTTSLARWRERKVERKFVKVDPISSTRPTKSHLFLSRHFFFTHNFPNNFSRSPPFNFKSFSNCFLLLSERKILLRDTADADELEWKSRSQPTWQNIFHAGMAHRTIEAALSSVVERRIAWMLNKKGARRASERFSSRTKKK